MRRLAEFVLRHRKWVVGVWGILPQCGPEFPAKSMEALGIQLTKMDLIPVDC